MMSDIAAELPALLGYLTVAAVLAVGACVMAWIEGA